MDAEDSDLVVRSKDGDLCAFNFIVQRYQSQVLNLSARILGDRGRAEDVTQETFISAFRAISRFRGGSLRAWLMRIAANASRDSLRGSRRRPEQSLDESLESPSFQPASGEASPEEHAERSELNAELQKAILSLSNDQKAVLVLIDVQGFSYEETAESIGASIGTVKSRLNRARRKVRDILMEKRELLPDRFRQ
ncbi:MAG: sigma-70 family RNA polymerase sigma factor [SAR202 cluster bacterium]|nr:sigma-70 family RNA polymerase sigma factor [SAR202 cluster bacterium]